MPLKMRTGADYRKRPDGSLCRFNRRLALGKLAPAAAGVIEVIGTVGALAGRRGLRRLVLALALGVAQEDPRDSPTDDHQGPREDHCQVEAVLRAAHGRCFHRLRL